MNRLFSCFLAGLSACVAISALGWIETISVDTVMVMAPFGATAVLIFGVPESPLSKTKNVIGGHLIAAIVGVVFVELLGVNWLTIGLAVGSSIFLMMLSKTTHPPAGATALLAVMTSQSWGFIFTPVLLGAMFMVLLGKLFNSGSKKLSNA
ncbi:HPP family protein [Shewanella sp. OPT22]|nr:HPP family protein [Shewanella sp. OPT22]